MNADVDYDLRMYEAIRNLRPWSPEDVVIDVGANDGRTVFRLMWHLPAPRIFAFEPVSTTFRTLVERTRDLGSVTCIQRGMGAEPGTATIYLTERAALNSLYPDWGPIHGYEVTGEPSTEEIQMTSLDRFVFDRGIDRIGLLKVDAEGHDLEVLKGASRCLRDRLIDIVQVEAGFDRSIRQQPTLREMQDYLKAFGYRLYGIFNQCRGRVGHAPDNRRAAGQGRDADVLIFCDALFVPVGAGPPGGER